jgi:hypothetical protein
MRTGRMPKDDDGGDDQPKPGPLVIGPTKPDLVG